MTMMSEETSKKNEAIFFRKGTPKFVRIPALVFSQL